jgi:hypothetical protein
MARRHFPALATQRLSRRSKPSVSIVLVWCMKPAIGARSITALCVAKQYRLPQLVVPRPEVQPVALEAVERQLFAAQVGCNDRELHRAGAHHDSTTALTAIHAAQSASLISRRRMLLQPAVQLRRAVPLPGPVPGAATSPRGRPPGAVAPCDTARSRANSPSSSATNTRRSRHRRSAARRCRVRAGADRASAQTAGARRFSGRSAWPTARRPRQPGGRRLRAGQQQHIAPLLRHQILNQRIGFHRMVRDRVQQMRLAALLPQIVVARRHVEEHKVAAAGGCATAATTAPGASIRK